MEMWWPAALQSEAEVAAVLLTRSGVEAAESGALSSGITSSSKVCSFDFCVSMLLWDWLGLLICFCSSSFDIVLKLLEPPC
jgi:hypothetical protein